MDNHLIGAERTPSGSCKENNLSPLSQGKLTVLLLERNNLCLFYSKFCLAFFVPCNISAFLTFLGKCRWFLTEKGRTKQILLQASLRFLSKSVQCLSFIFSYQSYLVRFIDRTMALVRLDLLLNYFWNCFFWQGGAWASS